MAIKNTEGKTFIEKNPITDEIKALVPEQYRAKSGISWRKQDQCFYVFLRLGYKYVPEKKRGIDLREPLGTIRDGIFKYSLSFLKKQEINQLKHKIDTLVAEKTSTTLGVNAEQIKKVKDVVSDIKDPRQEGKICFPLSHVMAVMLLSALGGMSSAVSIATYWKRYRSELELLFEGFPKEDISHDTVNRILRLINKVEFENILKRVAAQTLRQVENKVVHMDGHAVRASKNSEAVNGRYFFNAYDSTNEVVLGHLLIGAKENEITRQIEFLSSLNLRPGDMLTADALNTQVKLVQYLAAQSIYYCLAVKENHPKLHSEIINLFSSTDESQIKKTEQIDAGHGRIEKRTTRVISGRLLSKVFKVQWTGLEAGSVIETVTQTESKSGTGKPTFDRRYFISSYPCSSEQCAEYFQSIIRRHWTVENSLHWVLDNTFNQDRVQCTDENYLSNRVSLNKIALNILKAASSMIYAKTQKKHSISTMKELCSTPGGAIETLAIAKSISDLTLEA